MYAATLLALADRTSEPSPHHAPAPTPHPPLPSRTAPDHCPPCASGGGARPRSTVFPTARPVHAPLRGHVPLRGPFSGRLP